MTAMSREVRRVVVAHLASLRMNPAQIAAELGVSRETVRRDLHNPPPPAAPATGARVAVGEEGLSLPASDQLGKDLRLIAASHKRPADVVAAELLHAHAEAIRARFAASRAS